MVQFKNEKDQLNERYFEALEEATIYKHMIKQHDKNFEEKIDSNSRKKSYYEK